MQRYALILLSLIGVTSIASTAAYASQAQDSRIDAALIEQAFDLCRQAKKMGLQKPDDAAAVYQQYSEAVAHALKQHPTLRHDQLIEKHIDSCDKKYDHVKWLQASSVIDQGLDACSKARVALRKNQLDEAQSLIDTYSEQYAKATEIYRDLGERTSVKGKIKICDRMPEKIARKRTEREVVVAQTANDKAPAKPTAKVAAKPKTLVVPESNLLEEVSAIDENDAATWGVVPEAKKPQRLTIEPIVRNKLDIVRDELSWASEGCESFLQRDRLPQMLVYDEQATSMAQTMLDSRQISAQQFAELQPMIQGINDCKAQIAERRRLEQENTTAGL